MRSSYCFLVAICCVIGALSAALGSHSVHGFDICQTTINNYFKTWNLNVTDTSLVPPLLDDNVVVHVPGPSSDPSGLFGEFVGRDAVLAMLQARINHLAPVDNVFQYGSDDGSRSAYAIFQENNKFKSTGATYKIQVAHVLEFVGPNNCTIARITTGFDSYPMIQASKGSSVTLEPMVSLAPVGVAATDIQAIAAVHKFYTSYKGQDIHQVVASFAANNDMARIVYPGSQPTVAVAGDWVSSSFSTFFQTYYSIFDVHNVTYPYAAADKGYVIAVSTETGVFRVAPYTPYTINRIDVFQCIADGADNSSTSIVTWTSLVDTYPIIEALHPNEPTKQHPAHGFFFYFFIVLSAVLAVVVAVLAIALIASRIQHRIMMNRFQNDPRYEPLAVNNL